MACQKVCKVGGSGIKLKVCKYAKPHLLHLFHTRVYTKPYPYTAV